jgi:DNA-directed RNA polymerase subunit beta'
VKDLLNFFEKPKDPLSFRAIRISLAGPEKILEWSFGEVKKPETINYRTFKPERDGLFCARIFGPIKDYECICGKYKRMKHRGVVCEKCGVEVTLSKVRRERLGHIDLASPVAHIWFLRARVIGALLNLSLKDLERVLYCESYLVVESSDEDPKKGLPIGSIISEEKYNQLVRSGFDFEARMGGEVIKDLLGKIDLENLARELRKELREATTEANRTKLAKRLKVVEAFKGSGNDPEWMMMHSIPVIPPDLRPLVPLEAGRFATSDLNDLYRRVINRNNRLKRLIELNAPEIIVRNEKRMLQEAVDALFDNGRRGKTFTGANKRPLRSLSDMLKGKQGRFRQNLLGKRVDYSGRSVIVVGPELKLHQCGLPKRMALELFKPFIFNKLIERGFVTTIKSAKKMVEQEKQEVWDILEEVVREHPVLLNRAPTLHRLGIQAFEPVLIEGKAIQLHPLVCTAFNADFDGDQMAVHVPLSVEAQIEARVLMMSTNNILSPANGKSIITPSQDIVLGMYYLTRERPFAKGEGKIFADPVEARYAYDAGEVHLQAKVKCRIRGKIYDTTVGRALFSEILPEELSFEKYNKILDKKILGSLIDETYRVAGQKATVLLADNVMKMGYRESTRAGLSINVNDMVIPKAKKELLAQAMKEVEEVENQYNEGSITNGERYNKVIDIWARTNEEISSKMIENLSTEEFKSAEGESITAPAFNSIFMMADSGARGSNAQIRQLAGMRGLMAKPSGEIIENPITANFREGLSVLEYFISTHGARKGLADTALKTANSGYLTRRLVDISQDVIVSQHNCGTVDGIFISSLIEGGEVIEHITDRILGRVALEDVMDPGSDEVLVKANQQIDEAAVERIHESGIDRVKIRSILTCQSRDGICQLCYGRDLARGQLVNIGESVGVTAAQSIGEPGTQLTMRTFHIGGAASRRVEQSHVESKAKGVVKFIELNALPTEQGGLTVMNRNGAIAIEENGREKERFPVIYGAKVMVQEGQEVSPGTILAEWDPYATPILTDVDGKIKFVDIQEGVSMSEQVDAVTGLSHRVIKESKASNMRPRIQVVGEDDKPLSVSGSNRVAEYLLPVGATIPVQNGDQVKAGTVIAKIHRETTKTKDITGGLPRVAELFEARRPKDASLISEIDGIVSFGAETKGKRKVVITPEVGDAVSYPVPKGKHLSVQEGDYIRAGEPLMDGPVDPHDILSVLGEKALARYLVEEIQEVYRLQGVRINDKHIECIVRQMLKKVRVTEPGDTDFLVNEEAEKFDFEEANQKMLDEGKAPAVGAPVLQGITRASLSTSSFISAASFQETTKVLTEAAIAGKMDRLVGLKENVIMGRLIPAGTGIERYHVDSVKVADLEQAQVEDEGEGDAEWAPAT